MDAAALREFCHRERPPSVVLDNMFDPSPPAADAIELDIGQEMTRSFGRVLDCEAILSTGVVTVYFAEDGAAQRCAREHPKCGEAPADAYVSGKKRGTEKYALYI